MLNPLTRNNRRLICILFILGFALLFSSCDSDPDADLDEIDLTVKVVRADSLMLATSHYLLDHQDIDPMKVYENFLKGERDYFIQFMDLERQFPRTSGARMDSLLAYKLITVLSDSGLAYLLDTVRQVFPYDYPFAQRLTKPLKRLKKYFPDISMPRFYTHANGFFPGADLRNIDQVLSLKGYYSMGLHYFLGADYPFYPQNIYSYQRRRMDDEYLEVNLMKRIAEEFVSPVSFNQQPQLVDFMVQAGIKQYFLEKMLPHTPDSLRLYYTAEQMYWADIYEEKNYGFLLDKLFTTDAKTKQDFLGDKPYTSSLSLASAPRIGEYTGWKIVKAYMDRHPAVTLAELCEMDDYQKIFRESKYKP